MNQNGNAKVGCLVIFILFILIIIIYIAIVPVPDELKSQADKCASEPADYQERRKQLIDKYFHEGYLFKIMVNNRIVRCYVHPIFYTTTIDDKKTLANLILAYYHCGPERADILVFHDSQNGKEIGQLSIMAGFKWSRKE